MTQIHLRGEHFKLFLTESSILKGISNVAEQLNKDLKDENPLFLCVLNGAFMFASELIGRFDSICEVDFIRFKSYKGIERGEEINEIQGLIEDVENRHVVIIEDIIDTGYTINHLLKILERKNPATVKIATLLFKPSALQLKIKPDYVVKEIPNDFVIGFGLDYDGCGRNLRNIYSRIED